MENDSKEMWKIAMEIKDGGPRQGIPLDQRFLDRSEVGVSGNSKESRVAAGSE